MENVVSWPRGRHGYRVRDHCTWYAVAPATGFQATSGVEYTVGRERALARSRPFGVRPETYGVPPEVIAGRAAFPKLATRPASHASCGDSMS